MTSKYHYVDNTPTLKVRLIYSFGIISWLLVVYGFSGAFFVDPFFTWFVMPIILIFTTYHIVSFGFNLFYKQFDSVKHVHKITDYWYRNKQKEPHVNVFLPICGEEVEILKPVWEAVANLDYKNYTTFVLDDSSEHIEEHKSLAKEHGFTFIERPNKGEMKKAGNLKYAYERTIGEFIAIFDADFIPHKDFLNDMLPYMEDEKVGIVQSPQYFDVSKEAYKKSPFAYAAAFQEEIFYRVIQVTKDRFNAAVCCGSNAIYRREALNAIGGPRQVDASEDSRTGYAMLAEGYVTRYIPVILAEGVCPDNVYAYFHQQHRWCRGRSQLVCSKEFVTADVPLIAKLSNTTGFLGFFTRPFSILITFQLFWVLFIYNDFITFQNSVVFYPFIFFALVLLPLFHLAMFRKELFIISLIQIYAGTHALISVLFNRPVAWLATGGKHTKVSKAFTQTFFGIAIYLLMYFTFSLLAVRGGMFHVDYNYFTVQFWILFNLGLTTILLWKMFSFVDKVYEGRIGWRIRSIGLYIGLLTSLTLATLLL